MTTIRLRTRLDSNTVQIPELDTMIGKDVEMIIDVKEVSEPRRQPDFRAFFDAAKNPPVDLDALEKAVNELREISTI